MTTNTNTNTNTFATWTKVDHKVYGLRRTVTTNYMAHEVMIRIDGRSGVYRVDQDCLLGTYWEAIDGGKGFATLTEAKKFVTCWVKAARAQKDRCPRL